MDAHLMEVKSGVLQTYDGEAHEVHGGAYLSPEAYLTTNAELERLRERQATSEPSHLPVVAVLGAALLGLAAGFWLGRRSSDDD